MVHGSDYNRLRRIMNRMSKFRLLLVEDNEQDREVCRDTIVRYRAQTHRDIELIECESLEEALEKIDNTFDGAIIDMKLAEQGNEGNQVIQIIEQSQLRIPVAILTGTPDPVNTDFVNIGVFKKGDPGAKYEDLLNIFWEIYDTGLTRIMGGRGIIESTLYQVFRGNLLPQKEKWMLYGSQSPEKTEKALLRHALSHLLQLLDDDGDRSYPEEMYLYPPLTAQIKTGSIVTERAGQVKYVVMNPACDLVMRAPNMCNTDRVLLAEIISQQRLFPDYPEAGYSNSQKGELQKAFKNNKAPYFHWLPKTNFFAGGFINFRNISTVPYDGFLEVYSQPEIQISASFIKDIIARFSIYYARQGQPDINFDNFITPA